MNVTGKRQKIVFPNLALLCRAKQRQNVFFSFIHSEGILRINGMQLCFKLSTEAKEKYFIPWFALDRGTDNSAIVLHVRTPLKIAPYFH